MDSVTPQISLELVSDADSHTVGWQVIKPGLVSWHTDCLDLDSVACCGHEDPSELDPSPSLVNAYPLSLSSWNLTATMWGSQSKLLEDKGP